MTFDPDKHNRHSIRLYGHDYAYPGYYYVTMCTHDRVRTLGHVENERVLLSTWGRIAHNNWLEIPDHFPSVKLDYFVIMPNHVHGIVIIQNSEDTNSELKSYANDNIPNCDPAVGAQHAAPLTGSMDQDSLGIMIRSYKSSVTRQVNLSRHTPGAQFWQRNYYERIVRNVKELAHIREYIHLNPMKWSEDQYYSNSRY